MNANMQNESKDSQSGIEMVPTRNSKEINELTNDFYAPGTYNIRWDAIDSYGNQVSSGIYI